MNDGTVKPLSEINEFKQRAIKKVKINRSIKTVGGNENNPDSEMILNESTEYEVAAKEDALREISRLMDYYPAKKTNLKVEGTIIADRRDKFIEWLQGGDPAKVIDQKPVSAIPAPSETIIDDLGNSKEPAPVRGVRGDSLKIE